MTKINSASKNLLLQKLIPLKHILLNQFRLMACTRRNILKCENEKIKFFFQLLKTY